jgi:pilus assembly protein Flp/PilA
MKKFMKILKDVSGASAAEYALILAIVGAAIALAAFNLGGTIAGAMDNAGDLIENPVPAAPAPAPAPAPDPAP